MQRNQNQMMKKKSKLKWFIIIAVIIIIALLGMFFYGQSNKDSNHNTSSESSITSSQASESSNDRSSSQKNDYPYSVTFPGNQIYQGNYDQLGFAITTYSDRSDIMVASRAKANTDPTAHMGENASLVPKNISTKKINVVENGTEKTVKANTELKLSDTTNAVSADFFTPFNGNDTKIFAYTMNNGHIALAFTSKNSDSHKAAVYQAIEFTSTDTSTNNSTSDVAESSSEINDQASKENQAYADIQNRLTAARDAAIDNQNKAVAAGGSPNDVQSAVSAVIAESDVLKTEYPQYSDYIENSVRQLGY